MNYLAMIQARCGSTRLPNKVLKDICGKPQLQRVIERVRRAISVDEVMVVTSIDKQNLPILRLCADMGVRVGVGSEEDVLDRYYQTARLLKPEYVVRITADCPLIDPGLIDLAISKMNPDIDYCSNSLNATFADGLDLEIIKYKALEKSWKEAKYSFEREHVTQYIICHPDKFHCMEFLSPDGNFAHHRWTVDEPEDFELIEKIYKHFIYEKHTEAFDYRDVLKFLEEHSEIMDINRKFQRNEGLRKSMEKDQQWENMENGQNSNWKRAKTV